MEAGIAAANERYGAETRDILKKGLSRSELDLPPLTEEAGIEDDNDEHVRRRPQEPKPREREGEWVLRFEQPVSAGKIREEAAERVRILQFMQRQRKKAEVVPGEYTVKKLKVEVGQMAKEIKDENELRVYVKDLFEGLKYLHDKNIIHADMKP